ncbi:MAG: DNA topoisomerase I [Candidatus Woesearchaeota archaeon]
MVELIITEKPAASKKLAEALADKKPVKKSEKGVPYYVVLRQGSEILIGSAVGHLFTVAEKEKKGMSYPVFDIQWVPSYNEKKSAFSKKYADVLKKLSKQADSFTIACDYDVEGEVIGLNIVRYICNRKDANRMKFSTLTKAELVAAYNSKAKTLNWGQANAGETRHFLDYYYGINLSRALTSAIRTTGIFKILSAGRVQGPTLKIIVDREHDIQVFKPVPYWQIRLLGTAKDQDIEAWHAEDKFWDKEKASQAFSNARLAQKAVVDKVDKSQFRQEPPFPFDLTSLQLESYRVFRISPKNTLELAQNLYTAGFISYPRTSSQQIPEAIGYSKILASLSKAYPLAKKLVARHPKNGKKTDPAHPAIYPTGILGKGLKEDEAKLFDLIVKRFLSVFADPAVRETVTVGIDMNNEPFVCKGTRTVEKGWHDYYAPYVNLQELELPLVNKGDSVVVKDLSLLDKETLPPKRYTPSSIIKELERRGLGTKATRAQIIDTLFQRDYVEGNPIQATQLGIQTADTLLKYSPDILDEVLTRHFEDEMEEIREGKKTEQEVLDEAKQILVKILDNFRKKEKLIGQDLLAANKESIRKSTTIGKCPNCGEGELVIRKGKFGRFIACNRHPDCSTTFKLPGNCAVKVTDKICEHCNHPMILVIKKAKKPQELCINPDCSSKGNGDHFKERPCPKCKDGTLVVKKSVYGAFIACNKYPKCRHTESLQNSGNKKT